MQAYKSFIEKQGDWYHYRRRVPKQYKSVDPRRVVRQSLKTKDHAEALRRAEDVDKRVTAYWVALVESGGTHSPTQYRAVMDLAGLHGFTYRPFAEIIKGADSEFTDRAEKLEKVGADKSEHFQALFGTAEKPRINVSGLLQEFEKIRKQDIQNKSRDQLRVWRTPRQRAIANWLAVIGDRPIDEIDQYQAREFRDWWIDLVETKNKQPETANKDISHVATMARVVCEFHRLDYVDPFIGMRLSETTEREQFPFSRKFVSDVLLANDALMGLNEEARAIVFVIASSGARPSEIACLPADNIFLDCEIPYIKIDAQNGRHLKTRFSKRELPLCGSALVGACALKDMKSRRYFDATSTLSATANKFLRDNGLRETPNHTIYSLRHTFQDGLTALDVTDRMQTELMGHKFNRPVYGKGPTLDHKSRIMKKLAFEI